MRKVFASGFLLATLLIAGCTSGGSSTKQLDESTARGMIADYLTANHYEFKIAIDDLLPYLVIVKTSEDYATGKVGPYGPLLARLVRQAFVSQQTYKMTCPEVSGTFVRECPEASCNLGWFKEQWILRSVPGTNSLQGEYIFQSAVGSVPHEVSGTIEADGTFNLSCAPFKNTGMTCGESGPGRYYEDGGKGYLKFPQYYPSPQNPTPFVGSATGRKVTATLYQYSLTPKFKELMKSAPNNNYVVGGNFEVGEVTNLRLDTDTKATANYALKVDLNSTGSLFYPAGGIHGEGHVVFGKKPDQTWAIDSVTAATPVPIGY